MANGLDIVAEVDDTALSISLGYYVSAGARHETAGNSGVSHFLEHMQFKGTGQRSAEQVNREIDELGGNSNAYTSEDQTVYYLHVIPEFQSQAADLLTDIMRPSLRDSDFETERKVILEEIAMYEDQPPYGAIELSMEQFYGNHPLANRILGSVESVGRLSSTEMRSYHGHHYAANNVCLVATGAVDFEALIKQIERATEEWSSSSLSPQNYAERNEQKRFGEHVVPIASQQYVVRLQDGPNRKSPERFAWRLAANAIGDDGGSRLFWALVDTGLVDSIGLFAQQFDDHGIIATLMTCTPETAVQNWEKGSEVIRSIKTEPLTQHELELVRNRVCASVILAAERPSNRFFTVGNGWVSRGTYETLTQTVENYASVTLDQINAAAQQIADGVGTVTSVGPTGGLHFS